MADKKISALNAAALPLAGTEVLPIVQSGSTVKVASDDLTVKNVRSNATTGILQVVGPATGTTRTMTTPNANFSVARIDAAQTFTGNQTFSNFITVGGAASIGALSIDGGVAAMRSANALRFYNPTNGNFSQISNTSGGEMRLTTGGGDALLLGGTGDATVSVGNLVIGTAGKGIDFSAATHAAGMTSELLNDYEEGTWTPNQGAAISVVGAYSSSGTYTKVGRLVTVTAIQSGATSISSGSSGIIFSNLPFNVGAFSRFSGVSSLQFSAVAGAVGVSGTGNVYSAGALAGGDTIVTTISYEV
jgi:hypothetical protein